MNWSQGNKKIKLKEEKTSKYAVMFENPDRFGFFSHPIFHKGGPVWNLLPLLLSRCALLTSKSPKMLKQKACWKIKVNVSCNMIAAAAVIWDVREILFLKTVKKFVRIAWLLNSLGEGEWWKRFKWAHMYLVSLSTVTYPHVPFWKSERGSVILYGWALWASLPRCWHRELTL